MRHQDLVICVGGKNNLDHAITLFVTPQVRHPERSEGSPIDLV